MYDKTPPYVPYRTFRTFLEFLKEGIPDRIDRSVWVSRFSGSSGMQLMTSLKALNLIDDQGTPSEDLEKFKFNTPIAALMEFTNALNSHWNKKPSLP